MEIHLTIKIKFISSKNSGESQHMHSMSENVAIMIGNIAEEIINERFSSLLTRYQISFETSMKGSDFIFDSIDGTSYKRHRISLNRSGSDSPDWMKSKKATINKKNDNDKCFQCAVTAALNYQNIKNHLLRKYQRLSLF